MKIESTWTTDGTPLPVGLRQMFEHVFEIASRELGIKAVQVSEADASL